MTEDLSEKLRQKTVVTQVMERIKDLIASGQYGPGDRFPTEQELAERFGTGRSSIREAIRIFHHLGVVETRVPKGTFVGDRSTIATEAITWALLLGPNDKLEVIELRQVLEERGFRKVAEGWADGTSMATRALEALGAAVEVMEACAKRGDYDGLVLADYQFHETIVVESGNSLFAALFHTLHHFTEEEIRATHYSLSDLLEIARDHRDIVQSLRVGTVESAVSRHRAHFDRIRSLLESRNPT
ncbi:MAG: GntR family transcriptional regulator [Spirochaetales bacterium]